jgi:hypothetical protein
MSSHLGGSLYAQHRPAMTDIIVICPPLLSALRWRATAELRQRSGCKARHKGRSKLTRWTPWLKFSASDDISSLSLTGHYVGTLRDGQGNREDLWWTRHCADNALTLSLRPAPLSCISSRLTRLPPFPNLLHFGLCIVALSRSRCSGHEGIGQAIRLSTFLSCICTRLSLTVKFECFRRV